MHQYIVDTSYASKGLIGLLGHDSEEYNGLIQEQKSALTKEATFDIAFMQRQMHPAANYWHGLLSQAQEERIKLDEQIKFLEAQILDKKHSLSALAGALLQLGKQGISSVRGRPDNCPPGREVRGVDLKWLIWAGRNQALHYEEPKKVDPTTIEIFNRLNAHPGSEPLPDPSSGINLAYNVVITLGWDNCEQYEQDMISLIG